VHLALLEVEFFIKDLKNEVNVDSLIYFTFIIFENISAITGSVQKNRFKLKDCNDE